MARIFPKFGYNPITGEWNDSLTGEFLWSNSNVSEAVPDVMTPSTWSLWWIHHYEANPIQFPGSYPFCGNICGRPYLNLSLLFSLYWAIGKDARKEMQEDMIGSAPADLDIPTIQFSAIRVLRTVLPGMLKAQLDAASDRKKAASFVSIMPGWCRSTRKAILDCRDSSTLLAVWQARIKPQVVIACRMLRSVTMTLADPATKLHQDLSAWVGEADANAILSNFSGADADLESLGPLIGLSQVRKGAITRDAYLELYGHRGPHEMELFAPGAEDAPDWFEKRMEEFIRSAIHVDSLLAKQRAEAEAAWKRFETRFAEKAHATRQSVAQVAAAARQREQVRSEVTRIARVVRAYLLRAGELSELGEDTFFLSLDEVGDVLAGDRTSVGRIAARRQGYQCYSVLPPYPALIIGAFDPLAWAADPHRRSDLFDAHQKQPASEAAVIKGFAGSAGIVEGAVRRLDCPEDSPLLQQGEILVTVTTNVGWTPLFPRLAAIVTDVGAPLSHAAIVARELGIPAVVGCGNATMRLKTGDRVRVDGGQGIIEML